jgi:hypothetical protein
VSEELSSANRESSGKTHSELIRDRDEILNDILVQPHPVSPSNDLELEDFLWTGSGEFKSLKTSTTFSVFLMLP